MSAPSDLASQARLAFRATRLGLAAGAAIGAYEVERVLGRRQGLEADAKRRLGRAILAGAGLRVEVLGTPPRGPGARLVVANHRASFDIAMLLATLDDPVMLSRGDLADWPVIGRLAQHGDTVFVDRGDKSNGARAIRSMRRVLDRHRTLVVFPEGTTHGEPTVRPFQPGAFVAARGLEVELWPVGIAYAPGLEWTQPSMGAHLRNVLGRGDLRAAIAFGEPMRLHGRRSDTIAREMHDAVSALFERARAEVAR